MKKTNAKKTNALPLFAVAFTLCLLVLNGILTERACLQSTQNTVRIRVVASSDAPCDQALKMAVRDDVIRYAGAFLTGVDNKADAMTLTAAHTAKLQYIAENTLRQNGCDDIVRVRLVKEYAPVRFYRNFTFPSGVYDTLRIDIGNAAGKNFWCVMYPPLCLDSATAGESLEDSAAFDTVSAREIQNEKSGIIVRSALVDAWRYITCA